MRALIQRVQRASVVSDGILTGQIDRGLLVLVGIEDPDDRDDAVWLADKIRQMRIFDDPDGKMNLSLADIDGDILVVSQFTLHASTRKGNRPSFIRAARPEKAVPLYEYFKEYLAAATGKPIPAGVFGAYMQVELVNDGPVTIWLDTKNKE